MGMFDSFYVEIEGKSTELQSKRFDCVLEHYRPGDVVGGAETGVRVYLDQVGFDAEGKHSWRDEEQVRRFSIFLVIAHGVFVDFEVEEGEVAPEAALRRIRKLAERWEDSARLLNRLVLALSEKQRQVDGLTGRIHHVKDAIAEARRIRAGEPKGRLHFTREYTERLERGDDPLDVLEAVLGEDQPVLFVRGGPKDPDPLEPYRL
jgi:hypothetical protein